MNMLSEATAKSGQKIPRVLIIDDHPVVVEGWERILRVNFPCEIATAASVIDGWRAWRNNRPDIIVVDLTFGDQKVAGIKLITRIRRMDPGIPMLVFTMHRSPILARRALEAGANGIINKDSAPSEVCTAITQVLRGDNYLDTRLATQIALMNVPGARSKTGTRLTPREEEILGMITDGLSYREIADRACISYKTVSNVSLVLKEKLGANSIGDLVVKGLRYFEGG